MSHKTPGAAITEVLLASTVQQTEAAYRNNVNSYSKVKQKASYLLFHRPTIVYQ